MKRIQYGLSIITMFGSVSIHAMDDNQQLSTWAQQIETVAAEIPKVADYVSLLSAGSLSPVAGQTMNVPTKMKELSEALINTAYEMRAIQKIPIIEADILQKAKDRFEWEVKFLRPGNKTEAGKDRKYIREHLQELFKQAEIPDDQMPYMPNLIELMQKQRTLNESAKVALYRAKVVSTFDAKSIGSEIITPCLNNHLQGMQGGVKDHITQKISQERGCRYFALKAVRQWMQEQRDDENAPDEQDDATKRNAKKRRVEEDGSNNK